MDDKISLESKDIIPERLDELRRLFPEAFSEGKIDFKRLQQTLGEAVDAGPDQYGLNWAGKSDCFRVIQTPSVATLKPSRHESIYFDSTENLIIEGDNLEVLKLLQKSYHGKIKMIYIDPPYNTGNEFVYPDDYKEGLETYLRLTGQIDEDGFRLTSNKDTDGRFHSKWLSMMYPRLFLAKNLLRADGVIFVSIDDHEAHNLRVMMNEIFGEECFLGSLIWKRRQNVDSRTKIGISQDHEYILCYGRDDTARLRGKDKDLTKYANPDNDPRGHWMSADMTGLATKEQRPNLHYELIDPATGFVYKCPPTGWRYERKRMDKLIANNEIIFPGNEQGRPRRKKFLKDLESDFAGFSTILAAAFNTQGTREVRELFDGEEIFDFPKPVDLICKLVQQGTEVDEEHIVLDFFAGSGTTAHAVMKRNNDTGANCKYILVQLPEVNDNDTTAYRVGFSNIADICKERVRRAINKLNRESPLTEGTQDRGFKVFKLDSSNFKIWDQEQAAQDKEQLARQLSMFVNPVKPGSRREDILYELLLKTGLELNAKVEELTLAEQKVFSVADGALLIFLEDKIDKSIVDALISQQPQVVICLDSAFDGNDPLKTNTVLDMKAKDIQFRTV